MLSSIRTTLFKKIYINHKNNAIRTQKMFSLYFRIIDIFSV